MFAKGSKCPSGCRVQGLILQRDGETNRNLREVCQKAERCENMVQKSMRLLTDVCTEHLQVMVSRQSKNSAEAFVCFDVNSVRAGHARSLLVCRVGPDDPSRCRKSGQEFDGTAGTIVQSVAAGGQAERPHPQTSGLLVQS